MLTILGFITLARGPIFRVNYTLRQHGFSDAEIVDITTTAAARCFFSKTLDAWGAEPDENFMALDENLRQALTVGRPIRLKRKDNVQDR